MTCVCVHAHTFNGINLTIQCQKPNQEVLTLHTHGKFINAG